MRNTGGRVDGIRLSRDGRRIRHVRPCRRSVRSCLVVGVLLALSPCLWKRGLRLVHPTSYDGIPRGGADLASNYGKNKCGRERLLPVWAVVLGVATAAL